MIKSMTGYGKAQAETRYGFVEVEIKTLNHRYFEISPRLPESLSVFEDRLREVIRRKIARGRVNLSISIDRGAESSEQVYIDKQLAKSYRDMLMGLKRSLKLKGDIELNQIIALPNVIRHRPLEISPKKLWRSVSAALNKALVRAVKVRQREGRALYKDILSRAHATEASLKRIKRRMPMVVNKHRRRLRETLKNSFIDKETLKERLENEVASFAKSCDISEEVVRMGAHIGTFKKVLSGNKEAGRELDFIAQELYREANTVGAKAADFIIQKEAIKIKGQVEKVREQAQNIE